MKRLKEIWMNSSSESKDRIVDQETHGDNGDATPQRPHWSNRVEYMLSMVGFAIGLGNIWKFPYMAYNNGGGVFLIPYFLMLVFCGIPLFALETAVGQFCSQGSINVWRAVPIMQGVGFSMVMAAALVTVYYGVIIAYSLYYMFASFQFPLPWSACFSWADANCSTTPAVSCNVSGVLVANWTQENRTCPSADMITVPVQSPSEQYWDRVALQRSSGLDDTGPVVWHLALCLLLSSILVAVILTRGIKSSGKAVYFTATFPYVVILILLVRGVTLEGARDGIEFFIGSKSNWTKLAEGKVWNDAAALTFFTLSVGMGGIFTISSYSDFHTNVFLYSVMMIFISYGTSVLAGIAIFSILGHMAHIYRKPIGEVVKEGFGLAFIAYPEALTQLPISPLWCVLFFFMLFIIGVDSQFTLIEVIITCICDSFPEVAKTRRHFIAFTICAVIFLLALPCTTQAGIYWITLIDTFSSNWVLLILALAEVIGFIYIYGGKHFIEDVEMMVGSKNYIFWLWWKACWYLFSPVIIVVILLWSIVKSAPPTYGTVPFPAWGLALGWCMVAVVLVWIPAVAAYKLTREEGTFWKRLKTLCSPSEKWHPYLDVDRGERYSAERCSRRRAEATNNEQMLKKTTSK
ncbi:sodium- and chloride-dependent neutral and basic amino acid transporter B(0+)-like [Takifugu rubripes]|uniref:sodium- and chloride-dependent neutral and basic amino acid transporter B(0+)-like n=1 Tax=Takifugu rubripes TaxID=31033 RepID=UPI001145826D|nr:sodium- and chloride-dependent neutral and basic amino acid transporter B(0+)-like [Takifugu rubripes]